jgi:DNA-binding PadR family transcriptional regulator
VPLKHAVLALLAERRDYGYDLARRFEARVGPGWRLNTSAIYPALDQLEQAGLVASSLRAGGSRRSPRVVYTPTRSAGAALDRWLGAASTRPEPVRVELHLKLAFAQERHRPALADQLAAEAYACEQLLARYADAAPPRHAADGWAGTARQLVDAAVVARLRADLAWLRDARATVLSG